MRRDRAPPAKQGKHQEYIDDLSLHRQSLQNKQCFHNLYAYLSAVRNKASTCGGEMLAEPKWVFDDAGVSIELLRYASQGRVERTPA